jgi:hypothetical protein
MILPAMMYELMARFLLLVAVCTTVACVPSAKTLFAGWDTYVGNEGNYELRYPSPPWEPCTGTEYEEDCHECSAQLLPGDRCGGTDQWEVVWIPPVVLDADYLLVPPYKVEISWFAGEFVPLELAQQEEAAMEAAGFDVVRSARLVTLYDGSLAAEVSYEGPIHVITEEPPDLRPDIRQFRVIYAVRPSLAYRVALDTAIDINVPEAAALLSSFSIHSEPPAEEGDDS